ncbi:hypothetical protein [Oceanicoccus sp. KOV_DT_Chl]|uniref:hypothetical protein n=1 Tax=Oceanicoccus sp. KOV_DT_Chl TaxID=1904639 RepID=UPI000C7BF843|nr:hypothetical protein [Oceanicoccus sp. KOV_DT_Chl]
MINSNGGALLGNAGVSLNAGGSGPFTLSETINISSSQISSWQNQGVQRVLLRRVFDAPGATSTASAQVQLVVPVRANFQGARVSPTQRQLFATQDNFFNANWQIVAGNGYNNVWFPILLG